MSVRQRAADRAHYNYFRDYDPAIGRYIESDVIGLDGGINTYWYADGNPNGSIDRFGLQASEAHLPSPAESRDMRGRSCARQAFWRNYRDMETANTIGADRYFHCKANCEAARCGKGGFNQGGKWDYQFDRCETSARS